MFGGFPAHQIVVGTSSAGTPRAIGREARTVRLMAPGILAPDRYARPVERPRRKLPSKSMVRYVLGMTILEVGSNSQLLILLPQNLAFPVGGDGLSTVRHAYHTENLTGHRSVRGIIGLSDPL